MDVLLREGTAADAPAAARLLVEAFPHLPITSRRVELRLTEPDPLEAARHVAALLDGQLVAWCRSRLDVEAGDPTHGGELTHGQVTLAVAAPLREHGIGAALLADAEQHLFAAGAQVLHSVTLEDEPTRQFCSRRGWMPSRWSRYFSLDLPPLAQLPPPVPPEGVQILPPFMLEDVGTLYQAHAECVQDEPREVPVPAMTLDQWMNRVWRAPGHDPAAGAVLWSGGLVVSFALFEVDRDSGRLWSMATGTRRGWRGRGLATLAKGAALQRAAERGLHTAWTGDHSGNLPMATVNERLGYRQTLTQVSLVRHFPRPGATGSLPLPPQ